MRGRGAPGVGQHERQLDCLFRKRDPSKIIQQQLQYLECQCPGYSLPLMPPSAPRPSTRWFGLQTFGLCSHCRNKPFCASSRFLCFSWGHVTTMNNITVHPTYMYPWYITRMKPVGSRQVLQGGAAQGRQESQSPRVQNI